ncbi:cardiolipin synthase (CMP-forming) isoform X2 [Latimeria chalumnae]|uniref:cardiolipin synthase (CMP-forming) isoform X2 n=1 Tax=Latimeria chalumnae TaxID=7897 RepID=UPI0003C16566|nr:PREDICTED: cardiolipin synthase (CMP-forming) isoform X2 [Latimeria chalumnae]|eukprot:XP_005991154.1 PREDICTED: cardiolipin synthase (CMP-forming) isoform X2 [Latimeria chalumnae]
MFSALCRSWAGGSAGKRRGAGLGSQVAASWGPQEEGALPTGAGFSRRAVAAAVRELSSFGWAKASVKVRPDSLRGSVACGGMCPVHCWRHFYKGRLLSEPAASGRSRTCTGAHLPVAGPVHPAPATSGLGSPRAQARKRGGSTLACFPFQVTWGVQAGSAKSLESYSCYSTGKPALKKSTPDWKNTEDKAKQEDDLDLSAKNAPNNIDLYENPWTVPNILCMVRIGLSPVLGYLVVEKEFDVALGLFVLAGITDLLDGYIARNWAHQKSVLGSALDPLADKILISVLYVCLTCVNLIPVPLTAMILSRDIALIAAVFYVRYRTVPPPRTLSKYFNPCYATAQLKPTFISKVYHSFHNSSICIQLLPFWPPDNSSFKSWKVKFFALYLLS